jgi:hypothetical protein
MTDNNRHFYARDCSYGLLAVLQRPDGSTDSLPGDIYRFPTVAARDAFVSADVWDGNYHREAVSAVDVRAVMARAERLSGHVGWDDACDGAERLRA